MNEKDKNEIIDRYETRLNKLGAVPQALGWLKGRQVFRFAFLQGIEGLLPEDSIIDVGCAFGDLAPFLTSCGWHGRYLGVDIVPGLIDAGKEKYPELDLRVLDLQAEGLDDQFDWVFCSGALTSETHDVNSYDHLREMLTIFFNICRKGVAVNLLSPLVDYQSEVNFHPVFARTMEIVSGLSRRFVLRHDYMPYEYTLYIYKDDAIIKGSAVFEAHKDLYETLRNDR
jgi:SAM-dependent methyltransferase